MDTNKNGMIENNLLQHLKIDADLEIFNKYYIH